MDRIRYLLRKALTPITIMVIPHENLKPLNLKVPFFGILLTLLFLTVGVIQTYRLVVNGLKYPFLMERVDFYTQKFSEWNSTVTALKETERDFRNIFSLKHKDKILDTMNTSYSGTSTSRTLWEKFKRQVRGSMKSRTTCVSRKISTWPPPKDFRWKVISALPMGGETILSEGNGPSIPEWIYQDLPELPSGPLLMEW